MIVFTAQNESMVRGMLWEIFSAQALHSSLKSSEVADLADLLCILAPSNGWIHLHLHGALIRRSAYT